MRDTELNPGSRYSTRPIDLCYDQEAMGSSDDNSQYFRESTRAPLRAPITLQLDTFKEPEAGFTGNISLGGMFIEAENPLPVGTIVKFELQFEPPLSVVRGTAEVAWIRPDRVSEDKKAGIGLQFRHLEENGQVIVRGAVEEILQAQGLTVEPPTVEQPKPSPRSRRPRAATPAGKGDVRGSKRTRPEKKSRKKAPGKASAKGSKRRGPSSDQKKKLIYAIILIAVLIYVLTRTLG